MSKSKIDYIIGIDEVGRGALAGPVVVAAVLLPRKYKRQFNASSHFNDSDSSQRPNVLDRDAKINIPLRDSKKLTPRQREIWFKYLRRINTDRKNQYHSAICYAVANVSPKIIDKINISNAANLAATRALQALIKNYKLKIKNCRVYLDGGLFLNSKFCILNSTTVVKGDEKIIAIMLASIIAKVSRDRQMEKFHKKFPQYGFNQHKGYGTKKHIKILKKHGPSPIHRKSFKIKQ